MADYGNTLYLALDARRAREGAAEFKRAGDEVATTSRKAATELGQLDRTLDAAGTRAKSAGQQFREAFSFGAGLAGVAGLGAGIRDTVRTLGAFESNLARLKVIGGATATQIETIRLEAQRLAQVTPFGATEITAGILRLVTAGQSVSDALSSIKPAADLAVVGEIGLARAADIVTQALAQFDLAAGSSARIADVLAAAGNLSKASVESLGDALANSATEAKQLGIPIEELGAALALLSNRGLEGMKAGTGLKNVFLGLAAPSTEARKVLDSVGVSAEALDVRTRGLRAALATLAGAKLSIGQLADVFGREGLTAASNLIGGVEQLDELTTAITRMKGEADKQSSALSEGLNPELRRFAAGIEAVQIAIGESGLLSGLTASVSVAGSLVEVLGKCRGAFLGLAGAWTAAKIASWAPTILTTVSAWNASRFAIDAATGAMVRQQSVAGALLGTLAKNPWLLVGAAAPSVLSGGFLGQTGAALDREAARRGIQPFQANNIQGLPRTAQPASPVADGPVASGIDAKAVSEAERYLAELRAETELQRLASAERQRAIVLREAEALALRLSTDEATAFLSSIRYLLSAQEQQAAAAAEDAIRSSAAAAAMRARDDAMIDAAASLGEFTRAQERETALASLTADERERVLVSLEAERLAYAAGVDDVDGYARAMVDLVRVRQDLAAVEAEDAAAWDRTYDALRSVAEATRSQQTAAEKTLETMRFELEVVGLSATERERAIAVRRFEAETMLLQADAAAQLRGEFEALYDQRVRGEARLKSLSSSEEAFDRIRREQEAVFMLNAEREKANALYEMERNLMGLSATEREAILANYSAQIDRLQELQRSADLAAEAARGIGSGVESFLSGTKSGLEALRDTIQDVGRAFLRAFLIQPLTNDLFKGIGSLFGSSGVTVPTTLFSARGNAFSSGNVVPFASGGVVNGPTLFPLAGGRTGVMGEAGDEAIMPLARTAGGQLGVRAEGSGGNTIVHMTVYANDADSFRRSRRQIMSDIKRAGG